MSSGGNDRHATSNGSNYRRLLVCIIGLAGVATFFVLGEWQMLYPFSKLRGLSTHSRNASVTMRKKVIKQVTTRTADVLKQQDAAQAQPEKPVEKAPQPTAVKPTVAVKPPIKRIVLIGERHSGTSYTTRMLTKCYPDLGVSDVFVRYKHWFQPTPEFIINVTHTFLHKHTKQEMAELDVPLSWQNMAALEDTGNAFQNTLLIVMVRSPYDWIEAMREGPHHWPNHLGFFRFPDGPREDIHGNGRIHEYGTRQFAWQDFVKANMTLLQNRGDAQHICQNGFTYGTISPCRWSKELYPESVRKDYAPDMSAAPDYLNFNADKPNYELKPEDGTPFDNALEFRAAKIQNFLDIPNHWNLGGFLVFQHEEVNAKGSEFILEAVSDIVGMKASCDADPPKHQQSYQLPSGWEQWITEHADWETERSVGYEPRSDKDAVIDKQDDESKTRDVTVPESREEADDDDSEAAVALTDPRQQVFDRIVLLGERHSGTSYTTRVLEQCFPDIEVSDFLVRYKHWFQPTPDFVVDTTKEYLKNDMIEEEGDDMFEIHNQWPNIAALEDATTAFKNTLLIVMFRNPYDWLEAMRRGPHHWTNHFSLYRFPRAPVPDAVGNPWYGSNLTSWNDFIKANMTFVGETEDEAQDTRLCQYGFLSGTVTPCLTSKDVYPDEVKKDYPDDINEAPEPLPFSAHHPIYELEPNGKPYTDPLAFRTAKIQNFLEIPTRWDLGSFVTVQYEEINTKGSAFLLEQVSKIVGQEPDCEPDPPRNQPDKKLDRRWQQWITKNADWGVETKVGYEPRPVIKRIVLLGERHSGTSYTTRKLAECFPKLDVSDFLGRYKHWFQPTPEYMLNATKTILPKWDMKGASWSTKIQNQWPNLMSGGKPKAAFKDTLVIAMFRSPYDWLEAMREGPHHWPNHFDLVKSQDGKHYDMHSYDWKKFVSANMTFDHDDMERSWLCQNGYPFGAVSPCIVSKDMYPEVVKADFPSNINAAPDILPFNAHHPVYELDESGNPFANPLEMRSAKIKDFLDIPNKWDLGGFIKLKHEDVNEKGPLFLINMVAAMVGMESECEPDPARLQESKTLESGWADWITNHADWETEMEIGYEPRAATNTKQGL